MAPPNPLKKKILSNTGRTSALKNDTVSNWKLLELYVSKAKCTHAYLPELFHLATMVFRLVSVLFHLVSYMLFHLVSYMLFHFPRAISIEQRFSPYIFNGQFTLHTIKYECIEKISADFSLLSST